MIRTALLPILFCLAAIAPVFGQMEKTLYQTFDLQESETIQLDLYGDYYLEPWAGNTIMTETRIRIYDAPKHVLEFFITEKGRYEILENKEEEVFYLSSRDKTRAGIQYKEVTCYEEVEVKVFVPENYSIVDSSRLVLITPTTEINEDNN